jgi:hypothetical protein
MEHDPTAEDIVARVRRLDPSQRRAAMASLDALVRLETPLSALDEDRLPGLPDVPADALREAVARNEARVWKAREALYETGLTREQAARRIGVKPNQITNLLRDGKLLSIDGSDGLRLPVWQFDPEARRGRLEGIDRVAAVFPGRVLGLSSWMTTPQPALAGRTPREALLDGEVEIVVAVAAHVGT